MTNEDPQELFDFGDYQGAITVLQERIKHFESDDDRRLLSQSLLQLDETPLTEILKHSQAITRKTAGDYYRIGWCYLQLEQRTESSTALEQSLQIQENAWAYYLLAIVKSEGKPDYNLDAETKNEIKQLLMEAVKLPNCDVHAFLWLEELQDWSNEADQERIAILESALSNYPDSEDVRCKLAQRYIYRVDEFERGLNVLQPLLLSDADSSAALEARWLAYEAQQRQGHFSEAEKHLDRLIALCDPVPAELFISKGLCLLNQHRFDDSIQCFEYVLAESSAKLDLKMLALFGIVKAHLAGAQLISALSDMSGLVELCESIAEAQEFNSFGNYYTNFRIGNELEGFEGYTLATEVCSEALAILGEQLTAESKGWLLYILYSIKQELDHENRTQIEDYLVNSSRFLDHPVISGNLEDYYLNAGDIPQAVFHHLKSVLWYFAKRDPKKEFSPWHAEFHTYDKDGNFEQIKVRKSKDRKAIHRIVMESFGNSNDPALTQGVVLPFYKSFWREMLLEGEMYAELHEASSLILASSENQNVLFDYAYSLHLQGLAEQAEQEYRKLLRAYPDDAASLHNLALIVNQRNDLDTAIEISDKAKSLSPDDNVITDFNKSLHKKKKEVTSRKTEAQNVLVTKVVQATPKQIVKPIFNSELEKLIYDLLTQVFPNFLVFPNMACSAIFDYESMKQHLGPGDDFRYFLMAIVDLCVVSTTDYRPIVAFEVDSRYHDSPEQQKKDGLKDKFFALGGLPLIRLRPKAKQSVVDMKLEITYAIRQAHIGVV